MASIYSLKSHYPATRMFKILSHVLICEEPIKYHVISVHWLIPWLNTIANMPGALSALRSLSLK